MIREVNHQERGSNGPHYSPAIRAGDMLYISGQLPIDPVTRQKSGDTVREQTLAALNNVRKLVNQEFGEDGVILKTTAYISDIAYWGEVNSAYAEFFGSFRPARSIIAVSDIHFGYFVEIEAIAMKGRNTNE